MWNENRDIKHWTQKISPTTNVSMQASKQKSFDSDLFGSTTLQHGLQLIWESYECKDWNLTASEYQQLKQCASFKIIQIEMMFNPKVFAICKLTQDYSDECMQFFFV